MILGFRLCGRLALGLAVFSTLAAAISFITTLLTKSMIHFSRTS